MNFMRKVLAVCLIIPVLAKADRAEVVGVLDGDTVDILLHGHKMTRCRLFGIDAPEKVQAFGQASKKSLSDMVFRKTVDVRVTGTDQYGRAVCRLSLAGVDVNREQVARGMAWVYRRYNQDLGYYEAEATARVSRNGLWVESNAIPPWEYRHNKQAGVGKISESTR